MSQPEHAGAAAAAVATAAAAAASPLLPSPPMITDQIPSPAPAAPATRAFSPDDFKSPSPPPELQLQRHTRERQVRIAANRSWLLAQEVEQARLQAAKMRNQQLDASYEESEEKRRCSLAIFENRRNANSSAFDHAYTPQQLLQQDQLLMQQQQQQQLLQQQHEEQRQQMLLQHQQQLEQQVLNQEQQLQQPQRPKRKAPFASGPLPRGGPLHAPLPLPLHFSDEEKEADELAESPPEKAQRIDMDAAQADASSSAMPLMAMADMFSTQAAQSSMAAAAMWSAAESATCAGAESGGHHQTELGRVLHAAAAASMSSAAASQAVRSAVLAQLPPPALVPLPPRSPVEDLNEEAPPDEEPLSASQEADDRALVAVHEFWNPADRLARQANAIQQQENQEFPAFQERVMAEFRSPTLAGTAGVQWYLANAATPEPDNKMLNRAEFNKRQEKERWFLHHLWWAPDFWSHPLLKRRRFRLEFAPNAINKIWRNKETGEQGRTRICGRLHGFKLPDMFFEEEDRAFMEGALRWLRAWQKWLPGTPQCIAPAPAHAGPPLWQLTQQ